MATKHHLTNPLKLQFDQWLRTTKIEIDNHRGYASHTARALGVTKQTISRWINNRTPIPGWAAVALRQWMRKYPPGTNTTTPATLPASTEQTPPALDRTAQKADNPKTA